MKGKKDINPKNPEVESDAQSDETTPAARKSAAFRYKGRIAAAAKGKFRKSAAVKVRG